MARTRTLTASRRGCAAGTPTRSGNAGGEPGPGTTTSSELISAAGCRRTVLGSDHPQASNSRHSSPTISSTTPGPTIVPVWSMVGKKRVKSERSDFTLFATSSGGNLARHRCGWRQMANDYSGCCASSRTTKRSSSSTRSGSVPLCSLIPLTIFRGIPIPICSRYR